MSTIQRLGNSDRWSDVVIHNGVAKWVEVAADKTQDAAGQISQVLRQIDETLPEIGSDRQHLLQTIIHLANLDDVPTLNAAWDKWVPTGHAPIRACVQSGLQGQMLIEIIVEAAVA